jgi:outer membrane protein assembly factor BamD (BamD/ComL family)
MPRRFIPLTLAAAALLAPRALAQLNEYKLDPTGQWVQTGAPEPGSDAATIAQARQLLADGRASAARTLLDTWIKDNARKKTGPWLAQAYLVRGDAKTADGDEFKALYDYEDVINGFPGSPEFVTALERELEIGVAYLSGLKRKFFGLRIDSAITFGEELIVRVQERLPGSRLAERAGIELADFYYRTRDMAQAAEAYEIFQTNFPKSQYRQKAMQRRIYANIARFKGPDYDASGLTEAKLLAGRYIAEYAPQADQAGISDALVARLDESVAAQMLGTARWYLHHRDDTSARLTLRRLIRKYPQTVAATEAIRITTERAWDQTPPPSITPESKLKPQKPADARHPAQPPPADTKPANEPPQPSPAPPANPEPRP